jgi:uncharacterized protein YxeA
MDSEEKKRKKAEANRKYYLKNKEKIEAYKKEWRDKNPELIAAQKLRSAQYLLERIKVKKVV